MSIESLSFIDGYLREVRRIVDGLDRLAVDRVVMHLVTTRANRGRVFVIGVGGSAANASHMATDLRKFTGLEVYAAESLSEITAQTNDVSWDSVFVAWLKRCRLDSTDVVFVLSVGGGQHAVSRNISEAVVYANARRATVLGIVGDGAHGGMTAGIASACVIVPTVNPDHVTVHAESMQAVVWHLLVTHPSLRVFS